MSIRSEKGGFLTFVRISCSSPPILMTSGGEGGLSDNEEVPAALRH